MNRWPEGTAWRIIRRVRAGETLGAICASPAMPSVQTVVRWTKDRPLFGERVRQARAAAGRALNGQRSTYCEATAERIFERLCEGQAMADICADPAMPAEMTVYRWLAQEPAFREAVALARQIQGDRLAEAGMRLADGATPETAYLTDVRLKHLRWFAAKLWPRRYGPVKALALDALDSEAAEGGGGGGGMTVVVKQFTRDPDTNRYVPSREPARLAGTDEVWPPDADGRRWER